MTRTTIRSEDITAGQVKSADLASDAVDTTSLETDIALLGFKVAANGSMAAYNLKDQTIDAFEDASGIDASASTGESRNASNYYVGTATVTGSAQWHFGNEAIGASFGTTIQSSGDGANAFDASLSTYYGSGAGTGSYVGKDAGTTSTLTCSRWKGNGNTASGIGWNNATANGTSTQALEYSSDGASWTEADAVSGLGAPGNIDETITETASYRYWRIKYKAGSGDWRCGDFSFYGRLTSEGVGDMTLISNSTTADSTPTTGDIVMTYTNGAGTATVNTDLKAYISRDNGTTWTQATLTSEGTTGGHSILTAHNVDISSQPSGTSMKYKIETLNQSASKETRIQAVSLGWS